MTDNLEKIGQTVDELESMVHALSMPMPAEFHIEQFKKMLPEKIKTIKEALVSETGENPWE